MAFDDCAALRHSEKKTLESLEEKNFWILWRWESLEFSAVSNPDPSQLSSKIWYAHPCNHLYVYMSPLPIALVGEGKAVMPASRLGEPGRYLLVSRVLKSFPGAPHLDRWMYTYVDWWKAVLPFLKSIIFIASALLRLIILFDGLWHRCLSERAPYCCFLVIPFISFFFFRFVLIFFF